MLSILSRWLIQFCLYLSLKSCIPEISSSFLMTSLPILSSLVYPVTLLRKRISAASRRAMSLFVFSFNISLYRSCYIRTMTTRTYGLCHFFLLPKRVPAERLISIEHPLQIIKLPYYSMKGDRGSTVVKLLRYKSEGRWFDSKRCHWYF